ncbi:MAG: hypothetical protein J4G11_04270 [Acidimicrobiia bacterium]|nr:hypothetical protein [Acidimicrobiia bacterium]
MLYYLPSSEAALAAELRRLAPERIWMMAGISDSLAPPDAEIIRMPSRSEDLIEWIGSHDPSVVTGLSPTADLTSLHSLVMTGAPSTQHEIVWSARRPQELPAVTAVSVTYGS